MAANRINVGDRVVLTGTFKDADAQLRDPAIVTVMLRPPTGPKIVLTDDVVRLALGEYEARHVVDQAGVWRWTMTGTGNIVAVEASVFEVFPA